VCPQSAQPGTVLDDNIPTSPSATALATMRVTMSGGVLTDAGTITRMGRDG